MAEIATEQAAGENLDPLLKRNESIWGCAESGAMTDRASQLRHGRVAHHASMRRERSQGGSVKAQAMEVFPDVVLDVTISYTRFINQTVLSLPYSNPYYGGGKRDENISNNWVYYGTAHDVHIDLLRACAFGILFSCKELTFLKLSSIFLSIPPNFNGFKKLLELHLFRIEFESGAIESLVSGCPLLEKLKIKSCDGCDYLVISSPSLKVLVLELYDTKSICLKEAKNLIDFTLKTNPTRGLIKSLPKIKKFSLDNWIKESYADIILPPLLTSSFSSLEYLELDDLSLNDEGDFLYFVSVLKSSPRLIELVIRQRLKDVDATQVSDHSKELECRNCFLKLQTVNLHVSTNSQHGMSLIQFILANSPSLKTLNFWCDFELDTPMLLNISKDLLRMERASPKAQVAFLHLKGVVLL
ncbi:F-box/FBD/LRR-repeat protein At1g13570-like [Vicia villosa]|uniref:F-box/FBD/LRR-repeat protein At1g13570-like n=1 Tax=Vicia villosa TaxID=3911 RepID=UPI00273B1179|nr:F-box/FBD/LRR-repeat protein At1g13570-like [Vicia villosa]